MMMSEALLLLGQLIIRQLETLVWSACSVNKSFWRDSTQLKRIAYPGKRYLFFMIVDHHSQSQRGHRFSYICVWPCCIKN